jgi:hypothetical protein
VAKTSILRRVSLDNRKYAGRAKELTLILSVRGRPAIGAGGPSNALLVSKRELKLAVNSISDTGEVWVTSSGLGRKRGEALGVETPASPTWP